ncbi:MAG: lysophospholipid acyltransferase family protein [Novosphingobium sp.]
MAVLRSLVFYAVFYGGSIFFVLTAVLVALLFPQAGQAVPERWSAFHRACVRHILGIDIRIVGERPSQPVLYAVKHESFFEAIDLPTLIDRPVIFAKEELFRIPGWGRAALAYGVVPVRRDKGAAALRDMVTAARSFARSGRPLAIFPEGTRVPHGPTAPVRSGFAGLYKLLGLPVVPVAVNSGPLYHRQWKRAGIVTYRFGEPIPPGLPREEIEARVLAEINALNDRESAGSAQP